jgi:hypothetical protein
MNRIRVAEGRELGSIAPLGIGLSILMLAILGLTTSSISVFQLQARLRTLAEFAALNAAATGMGASEFLELGHPQGFKDLKLQSQTQDDGLTIKVVFCSSWSAPFAGYLPLQDRQICATGMARAVK